MKTEAEVKAFSERICDFVASKKDAAKLKDVQNFVMKECPDFDEFMAGLWIRGMCGTNGQYLIIWETKYIPCFITQEILGLPIKDQKEDNVRVARHWTQGGPAFESWDFSRFSVVKKGVAPTIEQEMNDIDSALDKYREDVGDV